MKKPKKDSAAAIVRDLAERSCAKDWLRDCHECLSCRARALRRASKAKGRKP